MSKMDCFPVNRRGSNLTKTLAYSLCMSTQRAQRQLPDIIAEFIIFLVFILISGVIFSNASFAG